MNIRVDDTVSFDGKVGIVVRRDGDKLLVRLPAEGNRREWVQRPDVCSLAEEMYQARSGARKFKHGLSLTGDSTLSELVAEFGYATKKLNSDSLSKVLRQLERAGLRIDTKTGGWSRDDKFKLVAPTTRMPETDPQPTKPQRLQVRLPDPFWPTALGLKAEREIEFLRALTAREPLLCLLYAPDGGSMDWLQTTWEGLMSWAFRCAQRFLRFGSDHSFTAEVFVATQAMLHAYFETSALGSDTARLRDGAHSLNLVTLRGEHSSAARFQRLLAEWPGPLFEFRPERPQSSRSSANGMQAEVRALLECLLTVAGFSMEIKGDLSPIKTLLWTKEASAQILARACASVGEVFSTTDLRKFKGSNESGTALALKAHLAQWIKKVDPSAELIFEHEHPLNAGEADDPESVNRIDLVVHGHGRFEVETMINSGPMEAFYHQKVFARLSGDDERLSLVVPNEAFLWAGPYLADLAHHMGKQGSVLIPGAGEAYLELGPRPLSAPPIDEVPWDQLRNEPKATEPSIEETQIRLRDVAGYEAIRDRVRDSIIWPEKHRQALRCPFPSSGILFFGPPGCGKSRLARALAGELEQEVRLLSPSDLRGAYVGWGQIMIREQFDWVAENERRMLVIDELDAVGRRREPGMMISDEMANVNELLVQLDRVSRLGRMIVGTTNYVASLDDALVRSGRFGRFLPVPPPDIHESVAIVGYHLKLLANHAGPANHPHIELPHQDEIHSLMEPLFAENIVTGRFFCGADLEDAVSRTYQRCVRQALGDRWPEDYANITLRLSQVELARSLREVTRSITEDAFRRFMDDINRYCGSAEAAEVSNRFRAAPRSRQHTEVAAQV